MKTLLQIITASAALLLAGCVTSSQLQSADYGPAPTMESAKQQAVTYFQAVLKDPYSAHYNFVSLRRGWLKDGLAQGMKLHAGWMLHVDVNAKNSFGGYTGWHDYRLLFVGGKLYNEIPAAFFSYGNAGELAD